MSSAGNLCVPVSLIVCELWQKTNTLYNKIIFCFIFFYVNNDNQSTATIIIFSEGVKREHLKSLANNSIQQEEIDNVIKSKRCQH